MNTAVAALAFFASSAVADWGFSATGVGSAVVVNQCKYPVKLCNVPSAGGGYDEQDTTLAPGESWSQQWTPLSNGNGWSIKLYKPDQGSVLQYEYTWHQDGIIWYDLSCVDGNPWDNDWEITAAGTDCSPKQQAYRYSTDDAYGMQSCSQDTVITVTVCTGVSVDNGDAYNSPAGDGNHPPKGDTNHPPAGDANHPPADDTYQPPAPESSYSSTTPAPVYTPPPMTTTETAKSTSIPVMPSMYNTTTSTTSKSMSTTSSPTTFSTSCTPTAPGGGVVIITEYVTVLATATHEVIAPGYERPKKHGHGHNH